MKIIGIAGPAQSGKDTIGKRLLVKHSFIRYAFADPIRHGLEAMFNLLHSDFNENKEKEIDWIGKSPRELMQTLGTEWGRNLVADDIWLRLAEININAMVDRNSYIHSLIGGVVITDVRFENEANWIRQQGGEIWHITRKDTRQVNQHTSEDGVIFQPNDDQIIDNNAGLNQLYEIVDQLMQKEAA